mmetsp:Transcript_53364/g.152069  ORF Transcript_53364/g.152069 Transcript_53364/m.152069 type:complete len:115 (+) Transcript_53364:598-942(+)
MLNMCPELEVAVTERQDRTDLTDSNERTERRFRTPVEPSAWLGPERDPELSVLVPLRIEERLEESLALAVGEGSLASAVATYRSRSWCSDARSPTAATRTRPARRKLLHSESAP